MMPTPAQLHAFASDERDRRKVAAAKAGQTRSDRVMVDDAIWSHIEHRAARFAGDPEAMKRDPWYWTMPEIEAMTRNIKTTFDKAMTVLDEANPMHREKLFALYHLHNWSRYPRTYWPAEWLQPNRAAA